VRIYSDSTIYYRRMVCNRSKYTNTSTIYATTPTCLGLSAQDTLPTDLTRSWARREEEPSRRTRILVNEDALSHLVCISMHDNTRRKRHTSCAFSLNYLYLYLILLFSCHMTCIPCIRLLSVPKNAL